MARRAGRSLLLGARRHAPRLYQWMASWFYEFYFSYRYAKEYRARKFEREPLISVVMPVYNPPLRFLKKAVESIRRQKYARWQLCIADDASTAPWVRPYLNVLAAEDARVKVVFLEKNQHIARATNAALPLATGDYFLFIDNDDVLFTPWALTAFVDALQEDQADLLYADNVMIDHRGAVQSFARKPDWEPEFLQSTCYVTHPLMVGRPLMEKLGEFRPECTGAQDIDLLNRATEFSPKVRHITKFLYGWRMLPGSVTTSTDAKPDIIARSLRSHNDLLQGRRSIATSVWPPFFKKKRLGAFKLQFSPLDRWIESVGLVVLGGKAESTLIEQRSRMIPYPISDTIELPDPYTSASAWSESLQNALSRIDSEYVLFLDASIDMTYTSAIDELLGYLLLDSQIGVVAGKVLDHQHRLRCSSYKFQENLPMLGEGHRDADDDGYWFKNRLAHNTLAVPGCFLATRTRLIRDYGLVFDTYGAYAVPDYCLRLREDGFRTVYNPWAVGLSSEIHRSPAVGPGYEAFQRKYHHWFGNDPYYRG
jgi:glycosyltransferase involved in cell wall biosynthesis